MSLLPPAHPRTNFFSTSTNHLRTIISAQRPGEGVSTTAAVSGDNRFKYFRRPMVPFLNPVPPEVLLARPQPTEDLDPMVAPAPTQVDGKVTTGMQTMFRESEAQTDPYTPDYTLRPGAEPEILTLATLSHGAGLPAGKTEVEMIERAREKAAFERSLPPTTDEASFHLRRKMMEQMELQEWSAREAEIDALQAERLEILRKAITERERENEVCDGVRRGV